MGCMSCYLNKIYDEVALESLQLFKHIKYLSCLMVKRAKCKFLKQCDASDSFVRFCFCFFISCINCGTCIGTSMYCILMKLWLRFSLEIAFGVNKHEFCARILRISEWCTWKFSTFSRKMCALFGCTQTTFIKRCSRLLHWWCLGVCVLHSCTKFTNIVCFTLWILRC